MIIPVTKCSLSATVSSLIHATLDSFRGRIGLRSAILINCIRCHSSKASLRGGRIWDIVGPSHRSTRRKPFCAPGCALLQANISLTTGSMPTRPSFTFSVRKTASNIPDVIHRTRRQRSDWHSRHLAIHVSSISRMYFPIQCLKITLCQLDRKLLCRGRLWLAK